MARVSPANLRARGSHRAELLTQFLLGTPVRLLRARGDWREVVLPDGYRGWTTASSLAMERTERRPGPAGRRMMVTALVAWVRPRPRAGDPALTDLVSGTVVPTARARGRWRQILLPGGVTGWLPRAALGTVPRRRNSAPEGRRVARLALRFRGCSYLWGGTTSKGFDCSGLVQRVFQLAGFGLPRDAAAQARQVVRRRAGTLPEPGDLVFFGRGGKVTHVGISLGRGRFVHAAGPVRVEDLAPRAKGPACGIAREYLFAGRVRPRRRGRAVGGGVAGA